jgi:hypothetical protein
MEAFELAAQRRVAQLLAGNRAADVFEGTLPANRAAIVARKIGTGLSCHQGNP